MAPMTHHATFDTAFGVCGIAWRGDVVVGFRLPEAAPDGLRAAFEARLGATRADPPEVIARAIAAVTELLATGRGDLTWIACDPGTTDQLTLRIHAITRAIPPGALRTYGDIARELGDVNLAQRVGQAMAKNRIPVIVPCHRVVGRDGKLTGFSADGGVELKRRLLVREGALAPDLYDG